MIRLQLAVDDHSRRTSSKPPTNSFVRETDSFTSCKYGRFSCARALPKLDHELLRVQTLHTTARRHAHKQLRALYRRFTASLMLRHHQYTIGQVHRVLDIVVVVSAWLLAYGIRSLATPLGSGHHLPPFSGYATLAPLVAFLWPVLFTWRGVYSSRIVFGRMDALFTLAKAHGLALLLFIAITYLLERYRYSRLVMVYFATTAAVGFVLSRLAVRQAVRRLRARGHNVRRVLAVGEGPSLGAMIRRFDDLPELGLSVAGVLQKESRAGASFAGKPVLGSFDELSSLLGHEHFDEVLIALPSDQQDEADAILDRIQDETVDICLLPDVHRFVTVGCEVEDVDGLPVLRLNDSPLVGVAAYAKRCSDVILSLAGLILFTPTLLATAALVRLTSRGPIIAAQKRVGLDGRTFRMFSFRVVRLDPRLGGSGWLVSPDGSFTAVGAFLQRSGLASLPQLWNVLRGDMSMIGPRPDDPLLVEQYRRITPHYMLRHKIKSGMTGWAQLTESRGYTSLAQRVECDLFYIRNWSITLDLKILALAIVHSLAPWRARNRQHDGRPTTKIPDVIGT